jgi:C4-type Zn-finger protein
MNCPRCQGLMLEEHMIDMEAGYGEMWNRSSRCANCGHRDDAVIQYHRRLSAKSVMAPMPIHEAVELDWESEDIESLAA